MSKKKSLESFVKELQKDILKFSEAYKKKHAENPEHYPLELPGDNAGLWTEFFIEFHTNGTV